MAASMKKKVEKAPVVTTDENIEIETKQVETKPIEKTIPEASVPKKPVYTNETPIPCLSIVSGELGMQGIKSGINYRWAERGDVTDVEYQDLIAAIRSNASFIFKPYFLIQDEELVKQFPQIDRVYSSLYSIKDLKDVLKLSPSNMKTTIMGLPEGAKESIKNIAATMINNGTLDSVQKIKILDEIFDTKLMMLTELFN